jgi:hypothetical protein
MKTPFFGGCACGAIRYESTAKPLVMFHCHCRDCQRVSGGPFTSVVVVPSAGFRILQGTPRSYVTTGVRGGHLHRGFCGDCGSPLIGQPKSENAPPVMALHAASLDDPSWFRPQHHIFVSDAQPWDSIDRSLPCYDEYAPS